MNNEKFRELIEGLEVFSAGEPEKYKRKVLLLAMAGYAYVIFILLVVVGLLLWFVSLAHYGTTHIMTLLKLGGGVGFFMLTILRALWVRIPPPEGAQISLAAHPRLAEDLREIRGKIGGPQVDVVVINDEFNAALSQVPRLGIFGWQKNYLVLGLPLLQSLSPDELKAVIAHEYGHLAGAHGKFSAWIYRIRKTWSTLYEETIRKETWGGFLLAVFINRYAPYFDAYTFVMGRRNEFDADRSAADVVTPEMMGKALVHTAVFGARFEEEFWVSVFNEASKLETPPDGVMNRLIPFDEGAKLDKIKKAWNLALAERSGLADTHPALSDRLLALGVKPELPRSPEMRAAAWYLGEREEEVSRFLSTMWKERAVDGWKSWRKFLKERDNRFQELAEKVAAGKSDLDEAMEHALMTEEMETASRSANLLEGLLVEHPESAQLFYFLGTLELREGKESGIQRLERAVELEEDFRANAWGAIAGYLLARGRYEEAAKYRETLDRLQRQYEQFSDEMDALKPDDKFDPHQLSPEARERVCLALDELKLIDSAWLVRKKSRVPGKDIHIIGLIRARVEEGLEKSDEEVAGLAVAAIDAPAPYVWLVFSSEREPWCRKISLVENSLVYAKKY